MKLVDVAGRNRKEAESIVKKAITALKKHTKYIGWVDQGFQKGTEYFVLIETNVPELAVDALESAVKNSPNGKLISSKVHPGSFDWAADTYIKDSAEVRFKF